MVLNEANFDANSYWVVAGAAMVLHGIKEYTNDIDLGCTKDIDLGCTKDMPDKMQEMRYKVDILTDGTRRIQYHTDIEIFENWVEGDFDIIDSIPVVSFEVIIMMKKLPVIPINF